MLLIMGETRADVLGYSGRIRLAMTQNTLTLLEWLDLTSLRPIFIFLYIYKRAATL